MTSRVEAFILKTQSGQWMVEVWRDGRPIECTAGLETELDAIEEARRSGMPAAEAIEDAASKRLRPIVMTKMVCILGLVPLWLFGGAVWTSLAVVMMGGLALGTLITLGLIPALYAAAYRVHPTNA